MGEFIPIARHMCRLTVMVVGLVNKHTFLGEALFMHNPA